MKFRVFTATVCGIACALSVPASGGMLVRPAVDNVKTVALISVYMNRDFYDVKAPRNSVNIENLLPFGKAAAKGDGDSRSIDDSSSKGLATLIAHGMKAYSDRLEGVGNLQWIPVADIVSSEAYRKFAVSYAGESSASGLAHAAATIADAQWFTAADMVRIPMEKVAYTGTFISVGGQKDPRRELVQLCKDLNVDAVAILEFDMAFKKPLTGLDAFGNLPAIPSVCTALFLVNKDGDVAVNSGRIAKGQGKRFDGKTVSMLSRDTVSLTDKAVDSYCRAIDKSAEFMKERLSKEFSRKK